MAYWIMLTLGCATVMGIGALVLLIFGFPFVKLNRWLGKTGDTQATQMILTSAPSAPAIINPGEFSPGSVAPREERHTEKEAGRKEIKSMVSLLVIRTRELLMLNGASISDARVLADAFGTVERLGVIPFCSPDGMHSEYVDEYMPERGPIQTAAYEISLALRSVDVTKVATKVREANEIKAGWHLGVV